MLKIKKRGRPKTGKTPIRDFRMSNIEWEIFSEWCRQRSLKPSEVIRVLLKYFSEMDLKEHIMFILDKYSDEEIEELKKEMKE